MPRRPHRSLILLFVVAALAALAVPAAAHPPATTDHNVSNASFDTLWSRDDGATVERNASVTRFMGGTSDVTYLRPPSDPDRWNRGELDELEVAFDENEADDDDTHTIHPTGVGLSQGTWIKDAYAEVVAVEPGARAHVADGRTTQVVPTEGTVRAAVDFRIDHDETNPCGGVNPPQWEIEEYRVEESRLRVPGTGWVERGTQSQTPTVDYAGLPARTTSLRFEAVIEVQVWRPQAVGLGCSRTLERRELTVRDTIDARPSNLTSFGTFAQYPDGDVGIFVFNQGLWAGLSLPDGAAVHSPFRYFSARRPLWDTLRQRGANAGPVDDSRLHVHPLRIHAYPSRSGVRTTAGNGSMPTVRQTVSVERTPPDLPDEVQVDVVRENYSLPYGYDVKYRAAGAGGIGARHLHGGPIAPVSLRGSKQIGRSNLSLRTIRANASHVRVGVRLRENDTGDPIPTVGTEGYVEIQGATRVNTSSAGRVNVTIDRPTGAVRARYVPAPWWTANDPYDGDRSALLVTEREEAPSLPDTVVRFFALVGPFLVLVFMLDRAFGLDVWPPWRRL